MLQYAEKLQQDLYRKQKQHGEDHRTDDFGTVFDGKAGSDVMAGNGKQGGNDADGHKDFSGEKRRGHRTDVGSQIHQLHVARCGAHVHFGKEAEHQKQERTGAGAVEPVIAADDQRKTGFSQASGFWHVGF